jgi:hypothetical protein
MVGPVNGLKVVPLERPRPDVAGALRGLADRIDAGEVGEVACIAIVLLGDRLHAYNAGPVTDHATVHFLLCAAATRVLQEGLEEIEL